MTDAQQIRGHLVEVTWDGTTLTANGTTKASQVVLRGEQRNEGPAVLTRDQITEVTFKDASALVNGRLPGRAPAPDGARYILHFRRKLAEPFRAFAAEVGAQR